MKNDVTKLLANKANLKAKAIYSALLKLYAEFGGAKAVYIYQLGYTPGKLDNLKYEMRKHLNISDKDIALEKNREDDEPQADDIQTDNSLLTADEIAWMQNAHNLEAAARLANPMLPEGAKTITGEEGAEPVELEDVNDKIEDNATPNPIIVGMPEDVSAAIKLRDEYPFLDDENLPMEMKALVTDKFRAYRKYAAEHAEILKAENEADAEDKLYELAKSAVASFQLNQDIKDELDYYRDSDGKVLGKVPSLANLKIKQEIAEMTEAELVKHRNNALKSVSKYEKAGNKKELLKTWKFRLSETEKRLKEDYNYQLEK